MPHATHCPHAHTTNVPFTVHTADAPHNARPTQHTSHTAQTPLAQTPHISQHTLHTTHTLHTPHSTLLTWTHNTLKGSLVIILTNRAVRSRHCVTLIDNPANVITCVASCPIALSFQITQTLIQQAQCNCSFDQQSGRTVIHLLYSFVYTLEISRS